jgi:hypothetical protein
LFLYFVLTHKRLVPVATIGLRQQQRIARKKAHLNHDVWNQSRSTKDPHTPKRLQRPLSLRRKSKMSKRRMVGSETGVCPTQWRQGTATQGRRAQEARIGSGFGGICSA